MTQLVMFCKTLLLLLFVVFVVVLEVDVVFVVFVVDEVVLVVVELELELVVPVEITFPQASYCPHTVLLQGLKVAILKAAQVLVLVAESKAELKTI